jgi:GNAT superfamily N-acetyltransferase
MRTDSNPAKVASTMGRDVDSGVLPLRRELRRPLCEGSAMSPEAAAPNPDLAARIRPMVADDLDAADQVMRFAFGTIRGLPDPSAAFGNRDLVRTRFRASPECAWVAETAGEVAGSVFATRWGSFAFFGPLTVAPALWDHGIGGRLLEPVLDAFARWGVSQAGLFTFAASPKHLGLYQKHGFWPGPLTVVAAKPTDSRVRSSYELASREAPGASRQALLNEIRLLTDSVFGGLDLEVEVDAVAEQGLGDTVLVRRSGALEGTAVCHRGAGTEAGSDTCYVKFGAVRSGREAPARFARLLDACEAYAAESGLGRVAAGVNAGRLHAYRLLLERGYRIEQIGVSMRLHPERPHFDTPAHYVLCDER